MVQQNMFELQKCHLTVLCDFHFFVGDFITEFFKLCCRKESAEEILGRGNAEVEGQGRFASSTLLQKPVSSSMRHVIQKVWTHRY